MPQASGAGAKYAYLDHATDIVNEIPPILNQWYTVFDAEDVRLIWCIVFQYNDETHQKNIEVRWTIDGNVYMSTRALEDSMDRWISRLFRPSGGPPEELISNNSEYNAGYYTDVRGQSFKVEVRMTEAPGTNQRFICYCTRETLEQT